MKMPVRSAFWGKLQREADEGDFTAWHPLEDHCADVAACAEALLTRTVLRRRLARLGGLDNLDDVQVARLCVLTALHDLGKFNQHFQNKGRVQATPQEGHVREFLVLFADDAPGGAGGRALDALREIGLERWGVAPDAACRLLFAAVGHHGRPVACNGAGNHDPARWQPGHGVDPVEGIRALIDATRRWFPRAWDGGHPLPAQAAFAHAFSGLVMLADWMGSDRELFHFAETRTDRMPFAREVAARALRAMHLDAAVDRVAMADGALDFTTVTTKAAPHDAQAKVMALPLPRRESLTLLESETGSGKTEAAVMRFLQLFRAGAVDGMYFALPTRTAATQLHKRLVRCVVNAFPDETHRPPVVLAVPGYLAVDDLQGRRLPHFRVLWNDDRDRQMRHRAWAAEHPKRFLAAAIAVGTIDQVLLSSLTIDHAHMRATSLLRQFLVVDEVHASDAYMNALLRAVLRFHLGAGGHALLMSATLGSELRESVFGGVVPTLAEARAVPYPLVTHREASDRAPFGVDAPGSPKVVSFTLRSIADDAGAVAAEALGHALRGARVLVIRNTVRDAVETQLMLESLATTEAARAVLFRCDGVVAPHHARYAKVDREALDAAIELHFGEHSPSVGRVIVATQTVQQSLDLDADVLLTDLCPMDVLLQRVGRLQRHKRGGAQRRPAGYDEARAFVLVPDDRDFMKHMRKDGELRGPHGVGTVYDDARMLRATWCQIEATPRVLIPTMNRQLVEQTTHPEALTAVAPKDDPRWALHTRWCTGTAAGMRRAAELFLIKRDERSEPFGEFTFPAKELGLRISSRLGEGDRRVVFEAPPTSPFGRPVRELTIPAWMAQGAEVDARPVVVAQSSEGFTFTFGGAGYAYDRLGLRAEKAADVEFDG